MNKKKKINTTPLAFVKYCNTGYTVRMEMYFFRFCPSGHKGPADLRACLAVLRSLLSGRASLQVQGGFPSLAWKSWA